MTVDEEFNRLEDDLRRLKVEYEVYFNGGSPRPPHDTLFRVENTIKRYSSDQSMLNFSQRFRFTSLAQKYAVNSNLWRRRLQEKEEGRTLTGARRRPSEATISDGPVQVVLSDPDSEAEKVGQLLRAMIRARKRAGQPLNDFDAAAFHRFIKDKTTQVKDTLSCKKVLFTLWAEEDRVRFIATKAG